MVSSLHYSDGRRAYEVNFNSSANILYGMSGRMAFYTGLGRLIMAGEDNRYIAGHDM